VERGVTNLGQLNLAATVPHDASLLFAGNVGKLLAHLIREGKLHLDLEDEITRECLVCRGGEITNPRIRESVGAHQS
jgi:NAD(P) transhydrogenase subunit alpha